MLKQISLSILLLAGAAKPSFSQKTSPSLLLNAGTNLAITSKEYYKAGLHLGGIVAFPLSAKNDAVTAGVGFHTWPNKVTADAVKRMDIKGGYRFFPSAKAPVYVHPTAGVGFFADGTGGKANLALGLAAGYLPKLGKGNLNIFAAYNFYSVSSGFSFINLGVGYQINFKKG